MKKIILVGAIAMAFAMVGCSKKDQALELVKAEKANIEKIDAIGEPAFMGCVSTLKVAFEKTKNPLIILAGGQICQQVTQSVIGSVLSGATKCSDSDKKCNYLAGCVKAAYSLLGVPSNSEQEKLLAEQCSSGVEATLTELEKQEKLKDNK